MAATGATRLGLDALARLTDGWRADLRVVATLREAPPQPDDPRSVVTAVRAVPGVAAARYVSPEAALADLRRYLGAAGEGLDRLPANPVPARLELVPAGDLDATGLRRLVERLGRLPGIVEVQAALDWVDQAERLRRTLVVAGLGLGGVLGASALLAVVGATRTARGARADETAVLRLAGVREAWIRGPLLLQALVQGAVGAALGLVVLLVTSDAGAPWVGAGLRTLTGLPPLPPPPWPLAAQLLGAGLAGGLAGGLAAGRP